MKKIFLILFCFLCLTGCGKKKISVEQFLSIAGNYGYISEDNTTKDKVMNPKVVQSISSTNNADIEIEFIIYEDMNSSFNRYSIIQNQVEKFKQQGYLFSNVSTTNHESYALNTEENYYYVARTEETFLYIKGSYQSKEEIVKFVEEIGY